MSDCCQALAEFLHSAIAHSAPRRGLDSHGTPDDRQAVLAVLESPRMSVDETHEFREALANAAIDSLAVTLGVRLGRAVARGMRGLGGGVPGGAPRFEAPDVILVREDWPRGGAHLAALFSQKVRESATTAQRPLWLICQGRSFHRLREQAQGLARAHGRELLVLAEPGASPTGSSGAGQLDPSVILLLRYDGDFGPFEESVRAALPPEEVAFEREAASRASTAYGDSPLQVPAERPPPEAHGPEGASERIADLGKALELFLDHKDSETNDASREQVLAENANLKELLEPMLSSAEPSEVGEEFGAASDPNDVGAMLDLPTNVMDDFRLLRCIGEGGMGIVFEAQQLSLDRMVALKVLPPHRSFASGSLTRFRREASAGARVQHPGIVAVYLVGEHAGRHYIAQELVPGGRNLADRLDELRDEALEGSAVLEEDYFLGIAELFSQIAEAMQAAHDAGVIHRDLKPGNLLLTGDGQPKVADFGLARLQDAMSVTLAGTITGSPSYMSPEQAEARQADIDNRTDVYGLGATMYEALTLESPFDGRNTQEILIKLLRSQPPDPVLIQPNVPERLARACTRAMAKSSDERFQSMREFAEELRQYLWEHERAQRERELSKTRRPKRKDDWDPKELVGTRLDDRFRLYELLGTGGFGAVYRARDERVRLEQDCAVKLFDPRAVLESEQRKQFRSTFHRVGGCIHPGLQRVYDAVISEGGSPYLVLDLPDGITVRSLLERSGRVEPKRVARILLSALDALSAAHGYSPPLLHLDLKPGNLFVEFEQPVGGETERVSTTLTDLGVAPFINGETAEWRPADQMSDSVAGTTAFSTLVAQSSKSSKSANWRSRACTPEYAAPEHCAHLDSATPLEQLSRLDGRADIYSLGTIGFELLTGALPYDRQRSRHNLARLKRTQGPKDVRQMGVKVPKALAKFITGCIAPEREHRFATAAEARASLVRYVQPKWWRFGH